MCFYKVMTTIDFIIYYFHINISTRPGAGAQDCERDRLWLRYSIEEMKYIGFRHSTHNESGEQSVLTLGTLTLLCFKQNISIFIKLLCNTIHHTTTKKNKTLNHLCTHIYNILFNNKSFKMVFS